MSRRVFWWRVSTPDSAAEPGMATIEADSLSSALQAMRAGGFHGVSLRNELGQAPQWARVIAEANPGRVCWCAEVCVVDEAWTVI